MMSENIPSLPDFTGLTFEKVWALFQENARQFKKLRKQSERQFKELREQAERQSKELREQAERTDRQMAKTDRRINALNERCGGISRSEGEITEQYFFRSLKTTLTLGDIQYREALPRLKKISNGLEGEFDIVLVNGVAVALIEVKHFVRLADLHNLLTKQADTFRRLFPEYSTGKKLYLAVAGFGIDDAVRLEAAHNGVAVLEKVGKHIESTDYPLKEY